MYIAFPSGSSIGTISCCDGYIVDDNHVENNEDFTVILGGGDGTIAPNNNTAYVRIIDNDGKFIGHSFHQIFYCIVQISVLCNNSELY